MRHNATYYIMEYVACDIFKNNAVRPKRAQERPKSGQGRPRTSQERPASTPDGPRAAQKRPQSARERPRDAQDALNYKKQENIILALMGKKCLLLMTFAKPLLLTQGCFRKCTFSLCREQHLRGTTVAKTTHSVLAGDGLAATNESKLKQCVLNIRTKNVTRWQEPTIIIIKKECERADTL